MLSVLSLAESKKLLSESARNKLNFIPLLARDILCIYPKLAAILEGKPMSTLSSHVDKKKNNFVEAELLLLKCLNRNSASESIKQKLIFVGSEEGKLLALRQSFAEV